MDSPLAMFGISPVADLFTPQGDVPALPLRSPKEEPDLSEDQQLALVSEFLINVTRQGLPRIDLDTFMRQGTIAEGGTFRVNKYAKDFDASSPCCFVVKKTKFTLPQDPTRSDPGLLGRLGTFLREISVATIAELRSHENILKVLGWDWLEAEESYGSYSPGLVIEFAELGTLDKYLLERKPEADERLRFITQVCTGLEALHLAGVVHGDIKQENVLLCRDPSGTAVAKISDFGNSIFENTAVGTYRCTPQYAAPELLGDREVPRDKYKLCDIFSYGLLVLEVVLGGRPYYEEIYSFIASAKGNDEIPARPGDSPDSFRGIIDTSMSNCREFATQCAKNSAGLFSGVDITRLTTLFLQTLEEDPEIRVQTISAVKRILYAESGGPIPRLEVAKATPGPQIDDARLSWEQRAEEPDMFLYDLTNTSTYPNDLEHRSVKQLLSRIKKDENKTPGRDAFILARHYFNGFGESFSHPPDVEEGLKWLEESAKHGHDGAHLVGQRIFEANGKSLPQTFSTPSWYPHECRVESESSFYITLLRNYQRQTKTKVYPQANRFRGEPLTVNDTDQISRWLADDCSNVNSLEFELVCNPQRSSLATLLHIASYAGDPALVRLLIDKGADVNVLDTRRQTPLLCASMAGSSDVIGLLLSHGANPTMCDEIGATPLHWIIVFEDHIMPQIATMLTSADAETCLVKSTMNYYPIESLCLRLEGTPLHWAIMARSINAIKQLLILGASPVQNLRDPEGHSVDYGALSLACGLLLYEIVPLFLTYQRMREPSEVSPYVFLGTSLEQFRGWIMHGRENHSDAAVKTIEVLIDAGYLIDEPDDLGFTPLKHAILYSYVGVVTALLRCGVDVNFCTSDGSSALFCVFEGNDSSLKHREMQILNMLLQAGADTNAQSEDGQTPLHNAILLDCDDQVISMLLDYDIDCTIRDGKGRSYLHHLAESDNDISDETLDRFILKKSDLDEEDNEGLTPLALAVKNFSVDRVAYLLSRGATVVLPTYGTVLHWIMHVGKDLYEYNPDFINFLLAQPSIKPCVFHVDRKGRTPLHEAARYAMPAYASLLLDVGADPNARDFEGLKPLELAKVCQATPPDFVVGDDGYKKFYERHNTIYAADLNELVELLSSRGMAAM